MVTRKFTVTIRSSEKLARADEMLDYGFEKILKGMLSRLIDRVKRALDYGGQNPDPAFEVSTVLRGDGGDEVFIEIKEENKVSVCEPTEEEKLGV